MKDLATIRELLHVQYLHMRRCNRIVQSDDFQIAFELLNEKERNEILLAIAEGNKEKLKNFVLNKVKKDAEPFEQMGITKLQGVAQHIGIKYYKNKTKLQLIKEIRENVTERLEKSCK